MTRVCLALLYYNPQLQHFSLPTSFRAVQHTTSTKSDAPHSRLASSFRRSLRNFIPAQTIEFTRKVFQRKSKDLLAKDSGDWADDFHLVTLEDLESDSPPSIVFPGHLHTISAHTKTSVKPHPTLPSLLIPDSKTTLLSTHTSNSKTATTGSSPTPTLTEVAHITSSFPHPPSHLPIAIASTSTSAFTPIIATKTRLLIHPAGILYPSPVLCASSSIPIATSPSVSSPFAVESLNAVSPPSLQSIRFRAQGIFRVPNRLSPWKSRK